MEYLASGIEMKAIDTYSIETIGIPSLVLMERAALAAADEICGRWQKQERILILCGTGNNGADGLAVQRILMLRGYFAESLILGDPDRASEEFKTQMAVLQNLGAVCHYDRTPAGSFRAEAYTAFVDSIFGIGLEREIAGHYRKVIEEVNQLPGKRAAVDIPSGVHAGSGQIMGAAFRADFTVTFGLRKRGMLLYPGRAYCGEVVRADIGFPQVSMEHAGIAAFTHEQADLSAIPRRPAYSNKGTFGKVLIIAGSKNMCGAAYFSAMAAYRTGAGLVRILTVEENREILQNLVPEAILTTYLPEDLNDALIEEACTWAGVIVIGPGLSQENYTYQLIESVLRQAYVPMVIDADGLNIVAAHEELTAYFTENIIITPHPGEMSRLVKAPVEEILQAPLQYARSYSSSYGITCVLKGAATVAACEGYPLYINDTGNSGMATAGTGDVLTGIIAGLLAMGMDQFEAAALGVYIHGRAGDEAKKKTGEYAMVAGDVLEGLIDIMRQKGETDETL